MFIRPYNIAMYVFAGGCLFSAAFKASTLVLAIAAVAFLAWDVTFVLRSENFHDRDAEVTLDHVVKTRGFIANFLGLYGLLFGFLLVSARENPKFFTQLAADAGVQLWMLVTPLVIAATLMLYIPINLSQADDKHATPALKSLFCVVIYFQKLAIFVFAYSMVAIASRMLA